MITTAELKTHTKADLAKMAKRLGVSTPSSIKKDELVAVVAKATRASLRKSAAAKKKPVNGHSKTSASTRGKSQKDSAKKTSKAKSGAKRATAASPKSRVTSATKKASAASSRSKRNGTVKSSVASVTSKPSSAKKASTRGAAKAKPSGKRKAAAQTKIEAAPKPKKLVEKKPKAVRKPKPTSTSPRVLKRIRELQLQNESNKDISFRPALVRPPGAAEPIWEKEPQKDRIALFVRDAYWMHAAWDITRNAIERAKAAMAEQWHGAKPVLRLLKLDDSGTTSTSETVEKDIEIHGGLRNWYVEWNGESARFRVLVGYLGANGRFHAIAKSNIVRTPEAGASDAVDSHWSDSESESERIFSLSGGYDGEQETVELKEMLEERLHRKLGAPELAKLGAAADGPFRKRNDFHFDMEIELVVYGSTAPDGYLTLSGEPVALRPDGTFVVRLPFPDRRQVLPAVSCSRDGGQQRTIVVAVERNTKIMEPLEAEKHSE